MIYMKHSKAEGWISFLQMTLLCLVLLFINQPKPWKVFCVHKICTQGYLEAFTFSNLLCDQVGLTLTNEPYWSHCPTDSKIPRWRASMNRRQSKEMVEGRENLQERQEERSFCCGEGSLKNVNGDLRQDR